MRALIGGVLLGLILLGCATSAEMTELEPRAEFPAKNSVSELRDCLFRWASLPGGRLEYHPEGIYVKDVVGSSMFMIVQRHGLVSVYVHWNMLSGKDMAVYVAGKCNDDVSSTPPNGRIWNPSGKNSLPDYGKYVRST